ncbi:Broad-complex core protein isoform 6 [Amphibalanus amphitrite]|nr:Broad-complex core protein isoform 6 [Amphibalanus amphitrite]
MMDSQKFCLKWDGFQSSVTSMFDHLRRDGELVDITLCCEGQRVKAHRMMLSACSPYFRDLLKNNSCQQMVIFLKDTSAQDLSAIIEFMYKGSVNVSQTQLGSFLKTAEMLQIRGLSGEDEKVEKVDLSDEDTSLDATIGYVADFEASSRSGPASGGVMALAAGPSAQRLQPYCLNSQGSVKKKIYPCDICGKVYHYRDSVYRHKRTHEGLTG